MTSCFFDPFHMRILRRNFYYGHRDGRDPSTRQGNSVATLRNLQDQIVGKVEEERDTLREVGRDGWEVFLFSYLDGCLPNVAVLSAHNFAKLEFMLNSFIRKHRNSAERNSYKDLDIVQSY